MINARIDFSKKFLKQLNKAPSSIRVAVANRVDLFTRDQLHPTLRNHRLKGILSGFRSINITGDWRAVYREEIRKGKNVIMFESLGTHSQLYK